MSIWSTDSCCTSAGCHCPSSLSSSPASWWVSANFCLATLQAKYLSAVAPQERLLRPRGGVCPRLQSQEHLRSPGWHRPQLPSPRRLLWLLLNLLLRLLLSPRLDPRRQRLPFRPSLKAPLRGWGCPRGWSYCYLCIGQSLPSLSVQHPSFNPGWWMWSHPQELFRAPGGAHWGMGGWGYSPLNTQLMFFFCYFTAVHVLYLHLGHKQHANHNTNNLILEKNCKTENSLLSCKVQ